MASHACVTCGIKSLAEAMVFAVVETAGRWRERAALPREPMLFSESVVPRASAACCLRRFFFFLLEEEASARKRMAAASIYRVAALGAT